MHQQQALQADRLESTSQPVKLGLVEVTFDEGNRPTVVSTGYRYPSRVDFSEVLTAADGRCEPRYKGWERKDGVLFDALKCRSISPLNPRGTTPVQYLGSSTGERMADANERARERKQGIVG